MNAPIVTRPMKPFNPHRQSQKLRRFKPTRKPVGIFSVSVVFCDAALLMLAFYLAVSPFVLQPGINIRLPASPFTGGAQFGSMILTVTRGDWYYFNDERLDISRLGGVLEAAGAEAAGAPLIIEADQRASHGAVVAAWNAALSAGISEVSMATRRSTGAEQAQ
jgi:biopolymer transport protein ExbD